MFATDRTPSWLYAAFVVGLVGTLLFTRVFVLVTLFGGMTLICLVTIVSYPLRHSVRRARRDPYDLGLLKEIHEREYLEAAGELEAPEDADILCPHCGHLFGAKFRVCPNCMRTP